MGLLLSAWDSNPYVSIAVFHALLGGRCYFNTVMFIRLYRKPVAKLANAISSIPQMAAALAFALILQFTAI